MIFINKSFRQTPTKECRPKSYPRDCSEILYGSGIVPKATIYPFGNEIESIEVFCDYTLADLKEGPVQTYLQLDSENNFSKFAERRHHSVTAHQCTTTWYGQEKWEKSGLTHFERVLLNITESGVFIVTDAHKEINNYEKCYLVI